MRALLSAFRALGRLRVIRATLSRFSTMMLSKEAGRELALFCRRCIWIFPHHLLFPVRWAVDRMLPYHVKVLGRLPLKDYPSRTGQSLHGDFEQCIAPKMVGRTAHGH